jgi:type I restriction enzyme M protein
VVTHEDDAHTANPPRTHNRPTQLPMFEQAFKNIDDVLWKDAGCTSELDYTE